MTDINDMFPKYIWTQSTGYLECAKTKSLFINSGEYIDGPQKFHSVEEAVMFLKEQNITGKIGIRIER